MRTEEMTKARETEILDSTIAKLGRASYLGPWLAGVRDELIASMANDFEPSPILPREAERQSQEMLATARADAEQIRQRAHKDADAIITKACAQRDAAREMAARRLREIADKVASGRYL